MNSCDLAWQFEEAGSPLLLSSIEPPLNINENEIVVLNKAIGINPVDWKFIKTNPLAWPPGFTPGVDGAGVVIQTGAKVPKEFIGSPVCYHQSLLLPGSFATYTVLKFQRVMRLPENFSLTKAASLPCPMLTAIQAFNKVPSMQSQKVLISGFGAVTKILIQILQSKGVHIDLLSSSADITEALSLGVNKVLRTHSQCQQEYRAVFDAKGKQSATKLASYLIANGHLVCIQDRIDEALFPAFTNSISYHEVALGALHNYGNAQAWAELMIAGEALITQLQKQNVSIDDLKVFPFEKLNEALTFSEEYKAKTVVTGRDLPPTT